MPTNLQDAIRYFSDPDRCLEAAVAMRWPHGVACPTCGNKDVIFLKSRRIWKCKAKHARQQFSVKVGSIFEDSPISLDKWFTVIWLIANRKNGVSSYEIARDLDVTQKTAWFMLQRIRLAMQSGSFEKMSGGVEADETFIGGHARNMHKADRARKISGTGKAGKDVVMGLLDRHTGKVRVRHVLNTRRETLQAEVRQHVEAGTPIFMDEWIAYRGLDREYVHNVINHAETYVKGNVHTNPIENFWACLKRGLKGTYISVEPFHLFRYLDEQAFRFNNRKATDAERFTEALSGVMGKRLTYKNLTGKDEPTVAAG